LLNTSVSVISSLALFARIFEYLDLPVEVDDPVRPVEVDPAQVTGHVRIEDVSFAYPGADRAAVAGVNLDIPAGSTLALVGETGSGKTTLASLIARLYDPSSGSIRIDGIDIRDIRLCDLAAIVGVVSQETYLLHTTVRENLRTDRGRGPGRPDPRPDRRAPGRLRHHGRVPRVPFLRRREAAHRHRQDPAARPARARA
jgi:ATP-binding cassette subfamily B protein